MTLRVRPMAPFGVELLGVDLRRDLPASRLGELRRLIVEEGLVLAREPSMTPEEQCRLGTRFGQIETLSLDGGRRSPGVLIVSNVADDGSVLGASDARMRTLALNKRWHTDSSFREIPAAFSLLRAVRVPDTGGDTFFASLRRAWDALTPEARTALYGLRAVHDYTDMGLPLIAHPIVRAHPESGRPGLFLSDHAPTIEGETESRGRALLKRLLAGCTRETEVYRHTWSAGDLVLWDNRSMLHRAQGFDEQSARTMHHVRIAGTEPVIAATSGHPTW